MTNIAVTIVGLIIAYLVYALNAEKFYAELLTRRFDAFQALQNAMTAREYEGRDSVVAGDENHLRPAQQEYFIACQAVRPLFGKEVERAIEKYDLAFLKWLNCLDDLRAAPSVEARERYHEALSSKLDVRADLSKLARPYINLGARGLPLATRLRIGFRNRRSDRRG